MCQYTYHHYRCCGHIAKWTVDSCFEFTNKLRQISGDHEKSTCISINHEHDFLPEHHPKYCLQCELDWQKHFPDPRPIGTDRTNASTTRADNDVLQIEGLGTADPILDLQAGMNLSDASGSNQQAGSSGNQPLSTFPAYDICHVGMALVPENAVGKRVQGRDLSIAAGRKHYNWKPQLDQLDSTWDLADVARIWGVIREDDKGLVVGNHNGTGGTTDADIARQEGIFYDSSSSPDMSASSMSSPSSRLPWSPASPVPDLPADEASSLYNDYDIYDWIPLSTSAPLTRQSLPGFEQNGLPSEDSGNAEKDNIPYSPSCYSNSEEEFYYDTDSEAEFDSGIKPFFIFSLIDVICGSRLLWDSAHCNASESRSDYDSELDTDESNCEEIVQVIPDSDSLVPTLGNPAASDATGSMNCDLSDTDQDIEYLKGLDDEPVNVTEVVSDSRTIYSTPFSSTLEHNNNNSRPRITIRIPNPSFSGGTAYNDYRREARYLRSPNESTGAGNKDIPRINWGLGIFIPEFHGNILQPHVD